MSRLERVARERGVVVTTGQQPGLFGGPLYTWYKALTAHTLADALERATGVPCAPVFWAATDDADYAEARWTAVALPDGARRIELAGASPAPGTPMAAVPLGDTREALALLARACGSRADGRALDAARSAYSGTQSVGDAYVRLLRELLSRFAIPVLDASHPSVRMAAGPVLRRALERAEGVEAAGRVRSESLRASGFEPQVVDVPGLSTVFEWRAAVKRRVPVADASRVAASAAPDALSPNVLLRPIVERSVLPTVAYVAGPAEIAYFAQTGAVADVLGEPPPLALPRWSGVVLEPYVVRTLKEFELAATDLADPHAAEGRIAEAAVPDAVQSALTALRSAVHSGVDGLATAVSQRLPDVPPASVASLGDALSQRVDRFHRRVRAAVKREQQDAMRRLAAARGALYPLGTRQERALNMVPLLARHGSGLLDLLLQHTAAHVASLVDTPESCGAAAPAVAPGQTADTRARDGARRPA